MVWQSETQSNKLSGDTVGIPLAPGNVLLKIILTGGRKILNWGEEVFTPGGNMQNPAEIPCVYKKKKNQAQCHLRRTSRKGHPPWDRSRRLAELEALGAAKEAQGPLVAWPTTRKRLP